MGDFAEAGPSAMPFAGSLMKIPLESITATDDATVVMKLTEPRLDALQVLLTDRSTFVMPPEVIEQHGEVKDWRNLVGTGPFILTDVVVDSSVTYTKNPDYWGYDEKYPENRLPYVDELRLTAILEDATIMAALRSGKIDFRPWSTSVDSAESIQKTNPEIAVHTTWVRGSDSFAVSHRKPPFNDINERVVVMRHAIKNALIPIVTLIGMQLPILIGGSVIMESIFNLPGLGRLMLTALEDRDYPVVSGVNLFFATAVVLFNLLIDLLYSYLDPRVRYD